MPASRFAPGCWALIYAAITQALSCTAPGAVTPGRLHLAPVRPPWLGARLEARDGVLFSFLATRSRAICRPMAFMSFLPSAEVAYMCSSRKRPTWWEERVALKGQRL